MKRTSMILGLSHLGLSHLALSSAALLLLAGCDKQPDETKTVAEGGEVLPGSISDAMIDLDTSTAAPPMAPARPALAKKASAAASDAADGDAADGAAAQAAAASALGSGQAQ